MKLNVNINYEDYDNLFLQMLYEGYESAYYSLVTDTNLIDKDPVRYSYLREDVDHNGTVVRAYETLARHYTAGDSYKSKLQDIRDRINYKNLITEGMSKG